MPNLDDFRFMLGDIGEGVGELVRWNEADAVVVGRFRTDPHQTSLGAIEPGLGDTESWLYCDRSQRPKPWPEVGEHFTIREQCYEVVELNEDDLGEIGFRVVKEELGIAHVVSEGLPLMPPAAAPEPEAEELTEHRTPGRPSRRAEVVEAYTDAVASGDLDPALPLPELLEAVRRRVARRSGKRHSLGDKTLRRILAERIRADAGRADLARG